MQSPIRNQELEQIELLDLSLRETQGHWKLAVNPKKSEVVNI